MPGIRRTLFLLRLAVPGGALLLLAGSTGADVLELRDGRVLEGRLAGANREVIHFQTEDGVVAVPVPEAALLRFPAPASEPGAPPAGTVQGRAGEAAVAAREVQIPAGTRLRVRVRDSLDPRQGTTGDRFAALLETPITVDGHAVVPARAVAYGVISAASPTGPVMQQLRLELTELQIAGRPQEIVTGPQARIAETRGAPTPASAADASSARIAAGSLLEFRLLQPLTLQPTR